MCEADKAAQTDGWQIVGFVTTGVLVHPVARNSERRRDLLDGEE